MCGAKKSKRNESARMLNVLCRHAVVVVHNSTMISVKTECKRTRNMPFIMLLGLFIQNSANKTRLFSLYCSVPCDGARAINDLRVFIYIRNRMQSRFCSPPPPSSSSLLLLSFFCRIRHHRRNEMCELFFIWPKINIKIAIGVSYSLLDGSAI